MKVIPRGPTNANILVVGETPSASEVKRGLPFVGGSGKELERLLSEAGIAPAGVRYTHVCMEQPYGGNLDYFMPSSKTKATKVGAVLHNGKYATSEIFAGIDNLEKEIRTVQPDIVVGLNNLPLWACTGEWGITKWRGSMMRGKIGETEFNFLPTYHPASILRKWEWRWIALHDLKRITKQGFHAWTPPDYDFLVAPSKQEALSALNNLLRRLNKAPRPFLIACDIETRSRQIACIGFSAAINSAFCIPIMSKIAESGSYWDLSTEHLLVHKMKRILTHPNAMIVGQNFLYDQQYLTKLWGVPYCMAQDTMILHHTCLPGTQKGLDFLSSLHCKHHTYWKDESKDWDPKLGEQQLWIYNAKDAAATFEIINEQLKQLKHFNRQEQYQFQLNVARDSFEMMLRGVAVNEGIKDHDNKELGKQMYHIRQFLEEMLYPFDIFGPKGISATKVKTLAYDILKLPTKYKVQGKRKYVTADKEAIREWSHEVDPIFRPILQAISDFRSLGVYRSTFAGAPLDHDKRFRCSINVAGPVTFRFSTGADAFGFGTNMQNIPGNQRKK